MLSEVSLEGLIKRKQCEINSRRHRMSSCGDHEESQTVAGIISSARDIKYRRENSPREAKAQLQYYK